MIPEGSETQTSGRMFRTRAWATAGRGLGLGRCAGLRQSPGCLRLVQHLRGVWLLQLSAQELGLASVPGVECILALLLRTWASSLGLMAAAEVVPEGAAACLLVHLQHIAVGALEALVLEWSVQVLRGDHARRSCHGLRAGHVQWIGQTRPILAGEMGSQCPN